MATKKQELAEFVHTDVNKKGLQLNSSNAEHVLSQLQFSDAAKKIILDPDSFNQNTKGLESIAPSNELLIQVKKSLDAIIDSLEQNPSILSSITTFWGTLSLTEKIFGGILISGPTLVVGVAANVGFLVTLSGLSAGAYITGGIVFEDHLEHTRIITERLKQGVFEIADVLVLTISALDTIRQKLAIEVEKFQEENKRLTTNVTQLSEQTYALSVQIHSYMITEKHLRQSKIQLEQTAELLKEDLEKNRKQYEETVIQIGGIKQDHEHCTQLLSKQIEELTAKRRELEDELEKTRVLATTLQGAVQTLSSTVINDRQQQQNFQARLENFVKNKEKSFTEVAQRICNAESELVSVKEQLKESLERHDALMEKQSVLIDRLELIDKLIPEDLSTRDDNISIDALCTFGLMAKGSKPPKAPKEETPVEPVEEEQQPLIKTSK